MNEAQLAAADRDKISSVLQCNGFMVAHAGVGWMTPAQIRFYWRVVHVCPFPEIGGGDGSLTDFLRRHPEMFFEHRGRFKPVITDRTRHVYEMVINQIPNGRGEEPLEPKP